MTTFDERKKGYESAHAHDEQMSFALEAKTCKHFGLWVATQLGLDGNEANLYAMDVIESNLEEAGFNDVLRKVQKDLDAKGVDVSMDTLNSELDNALVKAKLELEGN